MSGGSTLPCAFTKWDKNGDGVVNIEEFSSVGFPAMDVRDLVLAFQAIDTDGMLQLSQTKHVKLIINIIKINKYSSYYKGQISHI